MNLLTEQQSAERIGRTKRFIAALRKAGELEYLPSAGRAPTMILEESLNKWIKEQIWQASNSPRASKSAMRTGTLSTPKTDEAREQAFGRKIFKWRKAVSKVG
jgi:hypothetical protein